MVSRGRYETRASTRAATTPLKSAIIISCDILVAGKGKEVVKHARKAPRDCLARKGMSKVSFILSMTVARDYKELTMIIRLRKNNTSGIFSRGVRIAGLQTHQHARLWGSMHTHAAATIPVPFKRLYVDDIHPRCCGAQGSGWTSQASTQGPLRQEVKG